MATKAQSKGLSRKALQLAEGIFSRSLDLALWYLAFTTEMMSSRPSMSSSWWAESQADRFLSQINYEVIKNAIIAAKKENLVRTVRRGAMPEITQAGRKRLAELIPRYDQKRVWDNRIHLITYDIPEKRRTDRNLLRTFLVRLGCAKLQESVWMTPYNPIDTLRTFREDRRLQGAILVSDMGTDASIGEEDLHDLVVRTYKLRELNGRYIEWLRMHRNGAASDGYSLISYMSILKEDPQLPFPLLPNWWKGDEAYKEITSRFPSLI